MWIKQIVESEALHLIECFIFYSFIGWMVESIYMSFCNKKLTNRGFAFLPFCPIYGCGAVLGCRILQPLAEHLILLYLAGALIATFFEFLVGKLMLKLFHETWWDYTNKPFNFQGLICLESTVAWGFYAIIIVERLNNFVMNITYLVPAVLGLILSVIIIFAYMIDFIYHVLAALDIDVSDKKEQVVELYHSLRNRF